jgi:hypothetical protein
MEEQAENAYENALHSHHLKATKILIEAGIHTFNREKRLYVNNPGQARNSHAQPVTIKLRGIAEVERKNC